MRSLIISIILLLLAVLVIAGPVLESLLDRVIAPHPRASLHHRHRNPAAARAGDAGQTT